MGEAETGNQAIATCKKGPPDVVVMDIGLPDMNGIETTQVIVRNSPGIKVVMLSIYDDEQSVVSAIRAGAQGYVLKKASGGDLLEAIRTVANGSSYLSPEVSDHLLQRIKRPRGELTLANSALEALAPRELQVFHPIDHVSLLRCGRRL